MSKSFALRPFPSTLPLPDVRITGSIGRHSNRLSLAYALLGPLAEIEIPQPDVPGRRNNLWEETCFELFLSPENSGGYWEFNLSPSGHWNVYRFEAYRQGMAEEQAFYSLPFSIRREQDALHLSLELDLDRILPKVQALEVGITAVIRSSKGAISYWALTHPGPEPDFHRRDGFIIRQ